MRPFVLIMTFLLGLSPAACSSGDASTELLPAPAEPGPAPAVPPPGPETGGATARLARAPAATAAAGTARTTLVATVTGLPGRTEPMVFRGTGEVDFASGRSRSVLAMTSTHGGGPTGDFELETVTADGLLYVRAPALTFVAEAAPPWVRIDPTAARAQNGSGGRGAPPFGPLAGLAGSDLGAPLALLAGIEASSIREVGTDRADRTTITSLRATVDPVAASAGGATADDLTALETFLHGIGARRLEVEADLDDDDRLRRLAFQHEAATPAGPVHQRFHMEYSDFGTAVEILVPPDDQVRVMAQGPR